MIGRNLRKYRKLNKMTQKELAEKVDVSTGYIQMIELGKKDNPSMNLLTKIASVLEVPISSLINDDEEKELLMDESLSKEKNMELISRKRSQIFSEIEKRYNLLNLIGGIEALKRIDNLRFKIEYRSDKGNSTGLPDGDSFDKQLRSIDDILKEGSMHNEE